MFKFKLSKRALFIYGIVLILLIIIYLIFLPFLNIRKAIALDDPRYKGQEIVINSYNPIKPRISLITKVEDGFLITVEDYERNGLETFTPTGTVNGKQKGQGFNQFDSKVVGKSFEETIKIVQQNDQSNSPFTVEKTQTEKEYDLEEKKSVECRKPVRVERSYNSEFFSKIYKNMPYLEFLKLRVVTGEEYRNSDKVYFLSVKSNENNVIKYNIYSENKSYDEDENVKITKLTKVYNDCREEEVPLPEKPAN